jgi:hypothetical protein
MAVSPGRHVMLHAAHVPTAGALHDVPVSTFGFAFFFALSCAMAGPQSRHAATSATE